MPEFQACLVWKVLDLKFEECGPVVLDDPGRDRYGPLVFDAVVLVWERPVFHISIQRNRIGSCGSQSNPMRLCE